MHVHSTVHYSHRLALPRKEHLVDNMHDTIRRIVARGDDLRCRGAFGIHEDRRRRTTADAERELLPVQSCYFLAVLQVLRSDAAGDDVKLQKCVEFLDILWSEQAGESARIDLAEGVVVRCEDGERSPARERAAEVALDHGSDQCRECRHGLGLDTKPDGCQRGFEQGVP